MLIGVGVSYQSYSVISYLCVSFSVLFTSVEEERANFSTVADGAWDGLKHTDNETLLLVFKPVSEGRG